MSERIAYGEFKDYHSITIHGWMVNQLGLYGSKLLIYAAVFQYSSMGDTEFSGGEKALSALCHISVDRVIENLDELAQDRLILFNEVEYKRKKYRNYRINNKKVYACLKAIGNN